MKKLILAVLLLASPFWAQCDPFPKTLDGVIALINKDGFGTLAVSNIPSRATESQVELPTSEFVFTITKESPYRGHVYLVSSTRLNHPYSFNTNALISKLEAAGFKKTDNNKWELENGPVKAHARFGGIAYKMWADKPDYYELSVGYDFKDPDEPKTQETIKLW